MNSIRRRLVSHYVVVILVTVLALEGAFLGAVRLYYYGTADRSLANRVAVSASLSGKYLPGYTLGDKAHAIIDGLDEPGLRVEVIDITGQVVLNSDGFAPAVVSPTADVRAALRGGTATWLGRDPETGERLLAATSPLYEGTQLIGALRFVGSAESLHRSLMAVAWGALAVGTLVVILAFALGFYLARSIITPVEDLTAVAAELAAGRYEVRAQVRRDDEIGRLAGTLNRMSVEIMRSDQSKRDFLSSVSHELRTPLTSIKGWSETILSGAGDPQEVQQGLEIIDRETDRMIGLVDELLDFSRLASGRVTLHTGSVDISQLVTQVAQQYARRSASAGVSVSTALPSEPLRCIADGDRLRQVLINLLDNAVKFTPAGGTVRISAEQSATAVTLTVADSGSGIALTDVSRVTERFFKANVNAPGSGVGLSVVDEIVRLHGGRLDVSSALGRGTTITVTIPTVADDGSLTTGS